ncbi:FixH family protein [Alphaproteobacteria bacterium]|nr:FixH family protein [Alphaproteobacteria bacterium]
MNQSSSTKTNGWRLKGHHALIAFCSLFGLFIIANTIMVTTAITTRSGLDRPKAYIHGLKYNDVLSSAATQKENGWSGTLKIDQGENRKLNLSFRLLKDGEASAEAARATVFFRRPTRANMDQSLELSKTTVGNFVLPRSIGLAPGQWDVDVAAFSGPRDQEVLMFRSVQRVILK